MVDVHYTICVGKYFLGYVNSIPYFKWVPRENIIIIIIRLKM